MTTHIQREQEQFEIDRKQLAQMTIRLAEIVNGKMGTGKRIDDLLCEDEVSMEMRSVVGSLAALLGTGEKPSLPMDRIYQLPHAIAFQLSADWKKYAGVISDVL